MKKLLIIIAVVLALGIGAAVVFARSSTAPSASNSTSTDTNSNTQSTGGSNTNTDKVYTAQEVAQRNTSANCWTIIDGGVYDLTSYIPRHPGGNDITLACGVDGSSLFNERKTSDGTAVGSGTPHDGGASSQLQQLRIGTIQ